MKKLAGTIRIVNSPAGTYYEFEVPDRNGEPFAEGTSPTLLGAIDMMTEYLLAEHNK